MTPDVPAPAPDRHLAFVAKTYTEIWVKVYLAARERGLSPTRALDEVTRGVKRAREVVFPKVRRRVKGRHR
ncbi:MAG: hypothetical protein RLP09_09635 [Sandaracinaceae bacterium]